jgi:hypothetical protein
MKYAAFACLSRASSAVAVGGSAMGVAASVLALLTDGLSAGAPQAAKKTAAMAAHGNGRFLILSSHPYRFRHMNRRRTLALTSPDRRRE